MKHLVVVFGSRKADYIQILNDILNVLSTHEVRWLDRNPTAHIAEAFAGERQAMMTKYELPLTCITDIDEVELETLRTALSAFEVYEVRVEP